MIIRHQLRPGIFAALIVGLAVLATKTAIAAGPLAPAEAVAKLQVADGLAATIFAAEPMLLSPTNMDVDHRGRVWICEVVNYRGRLGERKEGDRILILEDTTGDGQADKQTVFYQGQDVDSALGICVLGNQVIVSVAPDVFVFTDEDGDDKPDRKERLFTKVGDPQHDHSTHAFTFGPDGKYYWCVGNHGKQVHDKDGKLIVDMLGREVIDNGKPYYGGMAFRCDPDGSNFEVLAHNFRNNYEVAVDSFGTLWQSDNDDDGNRATRINFVMEYGNYGYSDELTGAGWRSPRTGMAPVLRQESAFTKAIYFPAAFAIKSCIAIQAPTLSVPILSKRMLPATPRRSPTSWTARKTSGSAPSTFALRPMVRYWSPIGTTRESVVMRWATPTKAASFALPRRILATRFPKSMYQLPKRRWSP